MSEINRPRRTNKKRAARLAMVADPNLSYMQALKSAGHAASAGPACYDALVQACHALEALYFSFGPTGFYVQGETEDHELLVCLNGHLVSPNESDPELALPWRFEEDSDDIVVRSGPAVAVSELGMYEFVSPTPAAMAHAWAELGAAWNRRDTYVSPLGRSFAEDLGRLVHLAMVDTELLTVLSTYKPNSAAKVTKMLKLLRDAGYYRIQLEATQPFAGLVVITASMEDDRSGVTAAWEILGDNEALRFYGGRFSQTPKGGFYECSAPSSLVRLFDNVGRDPNRKIALRGVGGAEFTMNDELRLLWQPVYGDRERIFDEL